MALASPSKSTYLQYGSLLHTRSITCSSWCYQDGEIISSPTKGVPRYPREFEGHDR